MGRQTNFGNKYNKNRRENRPLRHYLTNHKNRNQDKITKKRATKQVKQENPKPIQQNARQQVAHRTNNKRPTKKKTKHHNTKLTKTYLRVEVQPTRNPKDTK